MSLDLLQVVLVQTRFPENIGMAARACVNMGSHSIRLVAPERWDREKARPLATPKGQGVLDDVQVLPDVSAAVADCSLVIGTTARTGGWRRSLLSPEQAAGEVAQALERGEKVAIVFGPDSGKGEERHRKIGEGLRRGDHFLDHHLGRSHVLSEYEIQSCRHKHREGHRHLQQKQHQHKYQREECPKTTHRHYLRKLLL